MTERVFVFSDKSKRGDTGKYELTLKNSKGEVKIPIDVIVLGKIRSMKFSLIIKNVRHSFF